MAFVLLFYNTLLTSILAMSVAGAYYLYVREGRRVFAALGVMFAVYLLDNTVVFATESIEAFAVAYDQMFISSPAFKTIYFLILMGCLLYVCYSIMRPRSPVPFYVITGVYVVLMICAPLITDDCWMVWVFYLPTQLIFIGVSIWGLAVIKKRKMQYQRPFYGTFRRILAFMLAMGTLILIEDTVVIFCYDVYSGSGTDINNRNWSENILFLILAGFLIKYTIVVLGSGEKNLLGPLSSEVARPRTAMEMFSQNHNLTERETEILAQLLVGRSQQEICDELTIALGTVKTHIHNVYQKTGVAKRSQLMARYQEFSETHNAEAQLLEEEAV